MQVFFTLDEQDYLYYKDGVAMIDDDCPKKIRKTLEKKIKTINDATKKVKEDSKKRKE